MNFLSQFRLTNILLLVIFSSTVFSSCQIYSQSKGFSSDPDWKYADLRLIDPIDSETSAMDLIAVYIRKISADFQIRIDFLDFTQDCECRILLALDTGPGGTNQLPFGYPTDLAWDSLIEIVPLGEVSVVDNQGSPISGLKLRASQDPIQDFITISVSSSFVHKNSLAARLQVFILGDFQNIRDQSLVISEYDYPPHPVNVMFGFWNTFNPMTPATALRSWDGAHSGMFRDRQGLRYLIESSLAYRIPVALLDFKTGVNLSALDYLGGLERLRHAVDSGMLTLPDLMPIAIPSGDAASSGIPPLNGIYEEAIRVAHDLSNDFHLPTSSIFVSQPKIIPYQTGYNLIVVPPPETGSGCILSHFSKNQTRKVLTLGWTPDPLCNSDTPEATSNGPSINLRRRLVNAYFNDAPFLILGGDFLNSNWGNPTAVLKTLRYITFHPWIHPISMEDLLTEPLQSFSPSFSNLDELDASQKDNFPIIIANHEIQSQLEDSFQNMLPGPIKNQFWAAYQTIFSQSPGERSELALNYLGQLGFFLPAYVWSQNPQILSSCSQDLDWDGNPECVLSDQDYFLIVDGDGGVISMAFASSAGSIHQLIGPTTQLAIGLSDPMDWDMTQGIFADPGQILGALQPQAKLEAPFRITSSENTLILRDDPSDLTEIISLKDEAINIEILTPSQITLQIPLLFDPWSRFTAGWLDQYQFEMQRNGALYWGSTNGAGLILETSGQLSYERFNQTRQAALSPEDPNFDYGAGHYLPFPLVLAKLRINNHGTIEIRLVYGQ